LLSSSPLRTIRKLMDGGELDIERHRKRSMQV
jgi:hypothetical protein